MAAYCFVVLVALLAPVVSPAQTPPGADSAAATLAASADTTAPIRLHRDSLMQGSLPELRVVGQRDPSILTTPTAVTAIDLRSTSSRAGRPISDVLASRTNLFVKQYGTGGLATASLRGLGSAHTLVLMDGHRLADPQTGQTDLSLVPSLLIESARIRHGSHGARYGSGSMGGVVELQTIDPVAPLRVEIMGGAGAYGWRSGSGIVSTAGKRWSGILAVERSASSGRFPYENTSLVPAQTERRENAYRTHQVVYGKGTYQGDRSQSTASVWWNYVDRGLPGTANASSSNASQTDTQVRLAARHRRSLAIGHVNLEVRGERTRLRFRNPVPTPAVSQSDTSITHSVTVDASTRLDATPTVSVGANLSGGYDRARVRGGVERWHVGASADATWSLNRITLHPAIRLDAARPSHGARPVTALSPQIGVTLEPGPNWLRLKGQVGRSFRVPTLNERYYRPGGNPDLRAESGWSAETGVAIRIERSSYTIETEATLFRTRLHEKIVWQPSYVGPGLQVWRPSNLAEVHTRGLEWQANGEWQITEAVRLDGRLTFSHVRATDQSLSHARSFGHQLPYTPQNQIKAQTGVAWGPARLDLTTRLVGRRYITADETQSLPPYQTTTAGLEVEHGIGPTTLTAHIELRNVFDESYSIVRLYPMPPRHARARLTLRFL